MSQLTGGAAILARLRAQKTATHTLKTNEKLFTILYGSQTGTAEDIANTINSGCRQRNIKSKVMPLDEIKFENLTYDKTPVILIVVSSTGDGDPPDNATNFFRRLIKENGNSMSKISYTLLGLGDSNYTSFMHVPRTIKKCLNEQGCSCFYEYCEADEVEGLEDIVDKFIEGLWEPLKRCLSNTNHSSSNDSIKSETNVQVQVHSPKNMDPDLLCNIELLDLNNITLEGLPSLPLNEFKIIFCDNTVKVDNISNINYETSNYVKIQVLNSKLLTSLSNESKRITYVELDMSEFNSEYVAGDAIGILPQNNSLLVHYILKRLEIDENLIIDMPLSLDYKQKMAHIKFPCTLKNLFSYLDITSPPKKSLLRYLADCCNDKNEELKLKFLSSKSGKYFYQKFIINSRPDLLDLLNSFPSCKPDIHGLINIVTSLSPRMYSIASYIQTNQQQQQQQSISFVFSQAKYMTPYGNKIGVASNWMEKNLDIFMNTEVNDKKEIYFPCFLRKGGNFHSPKDLGRPWIMIGPGTGVAPFIGFLQERKNKLKEWKEEIAEAWLYYGCRHPNEDYLFKNELNLLNKDLTLTKLRVAFSRQTHNKEYVQHLMKKDAKELFNLIYYQKAYIFVCGDGIHMAKDVHQCIIDILINEGHLNEQDVKDIIEKMVQEHSYVRDIWS